LTAPRIEQYGQHNILTEEIMPLSSGWTDLV